MAALNRGKESRPSWHSSRAQMLGSLLSVVALAATVAPMASVQRPSPAVAGSTHHCNRDFLAPTCVLVISDGFAPAIRYALGRRGVCLHHAA
jgi:predicted lysophospholipase L1 biosynthesis ABC-type transport system permease subunit